MRKYHPVYKTKIDWEEVEESARNRYTEELVDSFYENYPEGTQEELDEHLESKEEEIKEYVEEEMSAYEDSLDMEETYEYMRKHP